MHTIKSLKVSKLQHVLRFFPVDGAHQHICLQV